VIGLLSSKASNDTLFYKLKGKLEALLSFLRFTDMSFTKVKDISYLIPHQQAQIRIRNNSLGHIGTIHPKVKDNWSIKQNIAIFTINFDKIAELYSDVIHYSQVPAYPIVKRDISFWIDDKKTVGEILDRIKESQTKYVSQVSLLDIYENTKKDRRSIAIQLQLQAVDKTLSEQEITQDIESIMKTITKLRGDIRKG
jgi:phenylalanyl-tRNA synthetase beta chain